MYNHEILRFKICILLPATRVVGILWWFTYLAYYSKEEYCAVRYATMILREISGRDKPEEQDGNGHQTDSWEPNF